MKKLFMKLPVQVTAVNFIALAMLLAYALT